MKSFSDPLRDWPLKDVPSGFIKNPFIRFSISLYGETQDLLMAEYNKIKGWDVSCWVVGYITKDCFLKLNLPRWEANDNYRND